MENQEKTAMATVLGMRYDPSETEFETGVTQNKVSENGNYVNGRRVVAGGNGTYVTVSKSHFVMEIKVDGEQYEVWTEWTFKRLLGIKRLTAKMRGRIEATMPTQVEVIEKESWKGRKYYALSESAAQAWVKKAQEPAA